MKYLLSSNGLKELREFCSSPSVLFAFDLDGTLASIRKRPGEVRIGKQLLSLISKLSANATVAIVSGRQLKDIRTILPIEPAYLVGNHGLEGLPKFKAERSKARKECRLWETSLRKSLKGIKGLVVENKSYSISVHYRLCSKEANLKRMIIDVCRELSPVPMIIEGKMVVDLLHRGSPGKGDAIVEIMKMTGLKRVLYLGDDVTDESVFSLPDKYDIFKVKVGEPGKSSAKFFLRRQSETKHVLKKIIETLDLLC